MKIVPIPIPISVRNGNVMITEDNILLHPYQVNKIKRLAHRKTKEEWTLSRSGIKIDLTTDQKKAVVNVKNQILEYLSKTKNPKEILKQGIGFGFASHALERVLEKVERLSQEDINALGTKSYHAAVHPETLEKIVSSLADSQIVHTEAEWKGYPYLNFKFLCTYDDRDLELIVNFEQGILIITLIVKKETGFFIREIYSFENASPIKKPSSYLW